MIAVHLDKLHLGNPFVKICLQLQAGRRTPHLFSALTAPFKWASSGGAGRVGYHSAVFRITKTQTKQTPSRDTCSRFQFHRRARHVTLEPGHVNQTNGLQEADSVLWGRKITQEIRCPMSDKSNITFSQSHWKGRELGGKRTIDSKNLVYSPSALIM